MPDKDSYHAFDELPPPGAGAGVPCPDVSTLMGFEAGYTEGKHDGAADERGKCTCGPCSATEHAYSPIPDDCYGDGLRDGIATERARIVEWLRDKPYTIAGRMADEMGMPESPRWEIRREVADLIESGAHHA